MAELFDVSVPTINEQLKNIFSSQELAVFAVVRYLRITVADGKQYQTKHYSLDEIIAVDHRVNSKCATLLLATKSI